METFEIDGWKIEFTAPTIGELWDRQEADAKRIKDGTRMSGRENAAVTMDFFKAKLTRNKVAREVADLSAPVWIAMQDAMWETINPTPPSGGTTEG